MVKWVPLSAPPCKEDHPVFSPGPAQEAQVATPLLRTLGGDGVLRAARGGRLGAVPAGALQRVPAAPLGVELEAPRQGQCEFPTSLHLLTRLQAGAERGTDKPPEP